LGGGQGHTMLFRRSGPRREFQPYKEGENSPVKRDSQAPT
jgi:hypothetical protein